MRNLKLTKWAVVLGLIVSITFVSCEEQEREINLAENEEQRQDVYQQILSNEDLFEGFLAEMRDSQQMMRNMYTRQQVEATMMADPKNMDDVLEGVFGALEQDTILLRNPERRERMMQNMMNMIERDTVMYRKMRERMQEGRMNNQN